MPRVQSETAIFSNQTPVYFRVDLLRIMATIHTLEQCIEKCIFVYADMDVVPMNQDQLFDDETMQNSFHMVANDNPKLVKAKTQRS